MQMDEHSAGLNSKNLSRSLRLVPCHLISKIFPIHLYSRLYLCNSCDIKPVALYYLTLHKLLQLLHICSSGTVRLSLYSVVVSVLPR